MARCAEKIDMRLLDGGGIGNKLKQAELTGTEDEWMTVLRLNFRHSPCSVPPAPACLLALVSSRVGSCGSLISHSHHGGLMSDGW
jgi:hypothetical protein